MITFFDMHNSYIPGSSLVDLIFYIISTYRKSSRCMGEKYTQRFIKRLWFQIDSFINKASRDFSSSVNSSEELPF